MFSSVVTPVLVSTDYLPLMLSSRFKGPCKALYGPLKGYNRPPSFNTLLLINPRTRSERGYLEGYVGVCLGDV